MTTLVSGHGADPASLAAARRGVPHRRLALLTCAPDAADLATLRRHAALAGVDVATRAVDARDFLGCLAAAREVLAPLGPKACVVHVGGGPNLLSGALLLAAFQRGVDAVYAGREGLRPLPVAVSVDLVERFTPVERAILQEIPPEGPMPVEDLLFLEFSSTAVRGALLRLRGMGLVVTTRWTASLTPTGAYYRSHFRPARKREGA